MVTKNNLHRIRHNLSNMAYLTFDSNTPEQRHAFNEAVNELDRLIREMEKEYDQENEEV
jgi:hypothetical protein